MVGKVVKKVAIRIGDFIASGEFAVLIMAMVLCWTIAMGALMFWPETFSPTASFAASFRIWCFGYDPLSGHFDKPRVIMLFLDPIFIAALIGFIWNRSVLTVLRSQKTLIVTCFVISAGLVTGALALLAQSEVAKAATAQGLADYQLVRKFNPAPQFDLIDQSGKPYSLGRKHVTIVSAFYTHCQHTCPKIIEEARRVLEKTRGDLGRVEVALISLDSATDTVARLKETADRLKLPANWHLLTGQTPLVEKILDQYHVTRARDADGNIGHSNIFYVVDSQGRLAFEISLGKAQEVWLKRVIELLSAEG